MPVNKKKPSNLIEGFFYVVFVSILIIFQLFLQPFAGQENAAFYSTNG